MSLSTRSILANLLERFQQRAVLFAGMQLPHSFVAGSLWHKPFGLTSRARSVSSAFQNLDRAAGFARIQPLSEALNEAQSADCESLSLVGKLRQCFNRKRRDSVDFCAMAIIVDLIPLDFHTYVLRAICMAKLDGKQAAQRQAKKAARQVERKAAKKAGGNPGAVKKKAASSKNLSKEERLALKEKRQGKKKAARQSKKAAATERKAPKKAAAKGAKKVAGKAQGMTKEERLTFREQRQAKKAARQTKKAAGAAQNLSKEERLALRAEGQAKKEANLAKRAARDQERETKKAARKAERQAAKGAAAVTKVSVTEVKTESTETSPTDQK